MRRRQLKQLVPRLHQISEMTLSAKERLMKLGAARCNYPAAWRLLDVVIDSAGNTFSYHLNRSKLRQVRRRERRYLLRTNLTNTDPAQLCPDLTVRLFDEAKGKLAAFEV